MKNYKSILWGLLPDIPGVVFAFNEKYVFALIFFIISLISMVITLIISCYREKEKTEQVKIAEKEFTERTKNVTSESTKQLEIIKDILLDLNSSMPPEEKRKQNNNNILFLNEILEEKAKSIASGSYINNTELIRKKSEQDKGESIKGQNNIKDNNNDINTIQGLKELLQILQEPQKIKDDKNET